MNTRKYVFYGLAAACLIIASAAVLFADTQEGAVDPLTLCTERKGQMDCWHGALVDVLEKEGVSATFAAVRRLYEHEPRFPGRCHSLTHDIGLAAYRDFRVSNDMNIFVPEAAYCANGFYHGFMEGHISEHANPVLASELCARIGTQLEEDAPDAQLQCFHGIGHGAVDRVFAESGVVGVDEIANYGRAMCEEATVEPQERYRCASGVYNGIANLYIREELGITIDPTNPLALCRHQPELYQASCTGNMNSALIWLAGDDLAKAKRYILVDLAAFPAVAESAVRYLSAISIKLGEESSEKASPIETCRELPDKLYTACVEGLAHGHLEHGTPGREYEDAYAFCGSAALAQEERDVCFIYVVENFPGWFPAALHGQVCNAAPETYRPLCSDESDI